MSEWLPIETAPKDGTDVIVGYWSAGVWFTHTAFYRTDDPEAENSSLDPKPEDVGWWSYVETSVSQWLLNEYRTPTHWIPQPNLPPEDYSHLKGVMFD